MRKKSKPSKEYLFNRKFLELPSIEDADGTAIIYYIEHAKLNGLIRASNLLKPLIGKEIYAVSSKFGFEDVILKDVFYDSFENELYLTVQNDKGEKETNTLYNIMNCTDF